MKIILSLFAAIFLTSCNQSPSNKYGPQNIRIDIEEVNQIPLMQFFENVQFIPLEFGKESQIDIVEMLVYNKKRIFISSYVETIGSHELIIFNENGNFRERKYINYEGPGSMRGVKDFIITDDGNVEVLDRLRRKIIRYNADGKYVENVYVKANISKIEKFNDGSYVFYRGNSYAHDDLMKLPNNLIYGDKEGNIKTNSFVPIIDFLRDNPIVAGEIFFRVPGKSAFYFSDSMNDTIYYVDNKSTKPVFNLVLPDESYKKDKVNQIREIARRSPDKFVLALNDLLNDRKIISKVHLVLDIGSYIFLSFKLDNIRYYARVNKVDLKAKVYKLDNPILDNWFVFPYGDYMFVIIVNYPLEFKEKVMEKPALLEALPPQMKSYVQNLQTDDNPFLLVVDPGKLFSDE